MDMNEYELKAMAGERLAELRAEARVRACAPARRPLRVVLGLGLMRLGTCLTASQDHRGKIHDLPHQRAVLRSMTGGLP